MSRLELTTLGVPEIKIDGRSPEALSARKAQALLIYLALTGKPHSRQALSGLLWGEMPESNARRNLRVTLTKMRDSIVPFMIIKRRSLAIDPDSDVWLDVAEFEACLAPANPTLQQLHRAAELYQGHFLDDFNLRDAPLFEEWTRPLQERYRQMAMKSLYWLTIYHTEQQQYATGINYVSRLLALEPWMEEAHRQLMLLLALSGRRSAALAQYETCRDLLQEELGVAPSEATTALYQRVLNEEIEPDPQPPVVEVVPSDAAPVQIPASVSHFVGRADLLRQLTEQLRAEAGAPAHGLVGMGGVGKSALAVQVARRVQDAFPDGVLWASVAGSDPMAVLESWAAAYGCDYTRIADVESMAAAFRGVLAEKQVLVVLDDVDSVSRVRPLLPGGDHCRVLLTTRDLDLARALNVQVWPLRELSPANGRLLLETILGQKRVAAEPDAADDICTLLQNLPLALEIAAQRLKSRPRRRLVDVARRLRDETKRLSLLKISDREVRASFDISWESLDAERRRVFALIGLFNGRSFSAEAVAAIAEMARYPLEDHLFALVALSLLREEEEHRYRQHPLLADFAREQLGEEVSAENGRFAAYFLHFARRHRQDFDALRPEWDNLMAALQMAHENQLWQTVIDFANVLRDAWFLRGRFFQARRAYRLAHAAALALADEAAAAESLLWWGKAAVEQHDHEEALQRFEESRSLYTKLTDAAGIADCHAEMARVALEQSRFDEAITLLEESRARRRDLQDTQGVAETLYVEARVAYFRGDYRQAQEMSARALAIQEQVDDVQGLIYTLSLSASTAIQLRQLDQAEQFAEQAKALCEQIDNQSDKAIILDVFADIYRQRGKFAQAEQVARESLEMVQRFGDLGSQAQVLYQLSRIAMAKEKLEEAVDYGVQSLELSRSLNYKMLEALVLLHLGRVYLAMKLPEPAQDRLDQALSIGVQLNHSFVIEQAESYLTAVQQQG